MSRRGEMVRVVRERSRTDDSQASVETLGQVRPDVPKLLIWDNAPPHHPKRGQEAAAAAKMEIAWLPFRSPELNPCEDRWRLLKAVIAANRAHASLEEEAERAVAWLDGLSNEGHLRCCGLQSSKFQWLTTKWCIRQVYATFGTTAIPDRRGVRWRLRRPQTKGCLWAFQ